MHAAVNDLAQEEHLNLQDCSSIQAHTSMPGAQILHPITLHAYHMVTLVIEAKKTSCTSDWDSKAAMLIRSQQLNIRRCAVTETIILIV